jgi:hypothetical protein
MFILDKMYYLVILMKGRKVDEKDLFATTGEAVCQQLLL